MFSFSFLWVAPYMVLQKTNSRFSRIFWPILFEEKKFILIGWKNREIWKKNFVKTWGDQLISFLFSNLLFPFGFGLCTHILITLFLLSFIQWTFFLQFWQLFSYCLKSLFCDQILKKNLHCDIHPIHPNSYILHPAVDNLTNYVKLCLQSKIIPLCWKSCITKTWSTYNLVWSQYKYAKQILLHSLNI